MDLKDFEKDFGDWEELTVDEEGPVFWQPEPGDVIIGVSKGVKSLETKLGPMEVLHLETEDGDVYIKGHTVLKRLFPKIKKGWLVKIQYKGLTTSEKGRDYHDYKVQVKRGDPYGE